MIYSCFAGTGKTILASFTGYQDIDSADYQWLWTPEQLTLTTEERKLETDRVKNPDFPSNYVEVIMEADKQGDVLISAHPEVLDALAEKEVKFVTVAPYPSLKEEFIQRYIERGDSEDFIQLMEEHFEEFSDSMIQHPKAHKSIGISGSGYYLSDVLGEMLEEPVEVEVIDDQPE